MWRQMKPSVMALAVMGACAPLHPAVSGAEPSEAFSSLKQKFDDATKKFHQAQLEAQKEAEAANTDEEKRAAQKKMIDLDSQNPAAKFSPRFVEFAQQNLDDSSAVPALLIALQTSSGPPNAGTWAKTIELLQANYVESPDLKPLLREIGLGGWTPPAEKFLSDVIAKNPDRKLQAWAIDAAADGLEWLLRLVNQIKGNPATRSNLERQMGKEYVEERLARAETVQERIDELKKSLREKYTDVIPDLSVGKSAPEVVSQDLEGKETELSALKGKVVVLDIWTTWCGPCRAMIPHEREMVERYREMPFALISISADADKQTLIDFIAKEPMPWTHWWNGTPGGILEDWSVKYFPTIYVLDAEGVIRHKDLRGDALEKAVAELLTELDEKPTAATAPSAK
jgi:thiol-disulfide isomerase/thioredoxin